MLLLVWKKVKTPIEVIRLLVVYWSKWSLFTHYLFQLKCKKIY